MREGFPPVRQSQNTSAHSHGRETVQTARSAGRVSLKSAV
uniref:Uncharacterized protein n=1 Tax=Anguilla anguilla TaxID=7936 RepID=A0A0E9Q1V8_ANGAN